MQAALEYQETLEQTLLDVFADHAISAVQGNQTSSNVTFPWGNRTGVAHYSGDWFALDVGLARSGRGLPSNKRLWSLLEKNRVLADAKFVIPIGPLKLVARAEFPLTDIGSAQTGELRLRTACACTAIATAWQEKDIPVDQDISCGELAIDEPGAWLQDRLAEAGWQCRPGNSKRLLMDLEVTGSFYQAVIEQRTDAICLSVDVLDGDLPTDAVCRRALAIFMLRCAGASRMVSAVSASHNDGMMPRFQVLLSSDAQPALLGHALSSMSVACGMCAGVADVLSQDRALAQAYLALSAPTGLQ